MTRREDDLLYELEAEYGQELADWITAQLMGGMSFDDALTFVSKACDLTTEEET